MQKEYSEILNNNLKPIRLLPDDVAIRIILKDSKKYFLNSVDITSENMWKSEDPHFNVSHIMRESEISNIINYCKKKNIYHIRFKKNLDIMILIILNYFFILL